MLAQSWSVLHLHDGVRRRSGAAVAQVRRQKVERPGRLPTLGRATLSACVSALCSFISPLPRVEGAR